MSYGPRAAQMDVLPPEDYPAMREEEARYTYTVNAARLLERVEHVKYPTISWRLNSPMYSLAAARYSEWTVAGWPGMWTTA